jgi:hypothetical protein
MSKRQRKPKTSRGVTMVTDTEEQVQEQGVFERTIGGRTFHSPEELMAYVAEMDAALKSEKSFLKEKGLVATRAPSQRRVLAEHVANILNENMTDELRAELEKAGEDTAIRVMFMSEDNSFVYPAPKASSSNGSGTTGSRGVPLTVDGTEYPSAKNARDTLHPAMKDQNQNRKSIIAYLKKENHEVIE